MPYAGGPVGGLRPEPAPHGLGAQHDHGRCSGIYACRCPAPFSEYVFDHGAELLLRYAVVVADGKHDPDGAAQLAALGARFLTQS